jgi:hypothetical protein
LQPVITGWTTTTAAAPAPTTLASPPEGRMALAGPDPAAPDATTSFPPPVRKAEPRRAPSPQGASASVRSSQGRASGYAPSRSFADRVFRGGDSMN